MFRRSYIIESTWVEKIIEKHLKVDENYVTELFSKQAIVSYISGGKHLQSHQLGTPK